MRDFILYIRFAVVFALENATLKHIKQFSQWRRDMRSGNNTLGLELPWMTYDAIDYLKSVCKPDMVMFEWGSGGSTLFFAKRCRSVISIEHDRNWKKLLEEKLEETAIENVTYVLLQGEKTGDWAARNYWNPDDFVSRDPLSIGISYENYVKAIDPYPEHYFDLIVIDGRARNCCIKRAMQHLKKGGYLVVDNTDRKYYLAGFHELQNPALWEKAEFQGPVFFQHAFSKTSFFRKI